MIAKRNFENWFYMNETIAKTIYGSGKIPYPKIRAKHWALKNLGKILKRGVEHGALSGAYVFQLTDNGRKFYEKTFVSMDEVGH